jgi:hypothetical protein
MFLKNFCWIESKWNMQFSTAVTMTCCILLPLQSSCVFFKMSLQSQLYTTIFKWRLMEGVSCSELCCYIFECVFCNDCPLSKKCMSLSLHYSLVVKSFVFLMFGCCVWQFKEFLTKKYFELKMKIHSICLIWFLFQIQLIISLDIGRPVGTPSQVCCWSNRKFFIFKNKYQKCEEKRWFTKTSSGIS